MQLTLALASLLLLRTIAGTVDGVCHCSVTKCEHTANVNGCNSPLSYGSDGRLFCATGPDGSQYLYQGYASYVETSSAPYDTCAASSDITDYCSCTGYSGSTPVNTTLPSLPPTNAQGYSTNDGDYNSGGVTGSCYCDVQVKTNDASESLVGYFSIGSASQPVYCRDSGVRATQSASTFVDCRGRVNGLLSSPALAYQCRCVASTNSPTGNYQNQSTSQVQTSFNQTRISLVQSQVGHGHSSGGGGSSSNAASHIAHASASVAAAAAVLLVAAALL